jgi:predicted nucleic acid-binding protein
VRFVLDASVTLSWAFADEADSIALRAEELLESATGEAIVPAFWWYEVLNILVVNERRGRITAAETAVFLKQIAELRISAVPDATEQSVLDISRQTRLTVYDAAYLALAIEEKLPLATLDRALQSAARTMNISMLA